MTEENQNTSQNPEEAPTETVVHTPENQTSQDDTIQPFEFIDEEPDEVSALKAKVENYEKILNEDPIISQLIAARELGEDEKKVLEQLVPKDLNTILKTDPKQIFFMSERMKYPTADDDLLDSLYERKMLMEDEYGNMVLSPEAKLDLLGRKEELEKSKLSGTDWKSKAEQNKKALTDSVAQQTKAWEERTLNKKIFSHSEDSGYKITEDKVSKVKKTAAAVFSGKMPLDKLYDMILVANEAAELLKSVPKSAIDAAKAEILGNIGNVTRKPSASNHSNPPATEKVDRVAENRKAGENMVSKMNRVKPRF